MYIFNFYENYNQLKTSVASSNLDDALSSIKNIASLYVNGWHKEHELVTFRIEVINHFNSLINRMLDYNQLKINKILRNKLNNNI